MRAVLLCGLVLAARSSAAGSELSTESVVTLEQAVSKSVESHPGLAVARQEILIRRGEARQAGLPPNPRFSYEMENFGGENEFSGLRRLEQTARISQELEIGGKRGRRAGLAASRLSSAELEYRAALLATVAEVQSSFYSLLAAQMLDSLAREKVRLAHEVYNTVNKRVEAGKVSPVELSRAEVALSLADIETRRIAAGLTAARQALAAACGGLRPFFSRADGEFELLEQPPVLEEVLKKLETSPELEIARRQVATSEAAASLARAGRIPDLELSGGVKSAREAGSRGFVVEISLPVPLFNRNQGEIAAAGQAVNKAEYTREHVHSSMVSLATGIHAQLEAAYNEASQLRDRVVTGSERVFAATRIGYTEGKFGYLELLDAQRSMFEARGGYIEALTKYHLSRIELERLLGGGEGQEQWRDSNE